MVVFLLGLVLVVAALAAAGCRVHWLRGTLRTRAEVLGITSREEESGGQYNFMETVYVTQLQFPGTDGAIVYFDHEQGSKPRFRVGDRLRIRYHRTDPSGTAEVPFIWNELMIWFAFLMTAALGSGFLYGGLQMMRGRGTPPGAVQESGDRRRLDGPALVAVGHEALEMQERQLDRVVAHPGQRERTEKAGGEERPGPERGHVVAQHHVLQGPVPDVDPVTVAAE